MKNEKRLNLVGRYQKYIYLDACTNLWAKAKNERVRETKIPIYHKLSKRNSENRNWKNRKKIVHLPHPTTAFLKFTYMKTTKQKSKKFIDFFVNIY